ncbi:hypothetical protein QVH35_01785 [Candidatus Nitrosotenuis chungbukensis]|uniref:hypothetical protein n=1 Tax=Candidatus Nitrosotenuis chungbukensis TaxID=1353246 RepID=UPI002671FA3F|nr:hypothetical protein [Candidatus Nitrosotenuis chungbukensis]WKT58237.1 hypothetical protein QVH35_01785 [Candidatus Nitrosotenuis chungbukensis]
MKSLLAIFALVVIASSTSIAFADTDYDERLAFAGSLEETLGHFWAIEQNLDDDNAELALVHATHPIAELYDIMKPVLQESSPDLDSQVNQILMDLGKKTGQGVTRQDAQDAIDEAKEVVEIARTAIVGDELSHDTNFKMKLMQGLLETSKGEYEEAITDGEISMMAEFQDGSAFVWRSQQIFDEIKSELPEHEAEEIEEFYGDLWAGYDSRADPANIAVFADGVIHEA